MANHIDSLTGLSDLWPFRPKPVREESFSSWFSRLAWSNGLSPQELYHIALPGSRLYHIDLERHVCNELVNNLALHTGLNPDDLWRRTLQYWSGRLFERDNGHIKIPWIPTAGTHQSLNSYGQQVCTDCLSEAQVPYLHRYWRLSFVTGCKRHGVFLRDRCPDCASLIQPLYTSAHPGSVSSCWRCGFDFRKAERDTCVDPTGMSVQQKLISIAERGWQKMGAYGPVYSLSYFRILWLVYRLLVAGRFAMLLREWIGRHAKIPIPPAGIPRIKEVERLNPRCRRALIGMAYFLLGDWPHRFIRTCSDNGISSRVLIKDQWETPFALWEPVVLNLNNPYGTISEKEILAAKCYLVSRGKKPTYRELCSLVGMKFQKYSHLAEPDGFRRPYGTSRYWKLDGVSPDIREAAKKAAKHEGENVGPWVDKALRVTLERKNFI